MVVDGIEGPQTRHLAESVIRNKANSIVAIFNYVRENLPYVPDPTVGFRQAERLVNPEQFSYDLLRGVSRCEDCDGHSVLIAALGGSVGIPSRIALIDSNFDGELDYAVAQLWSDKIGWINVGTTSDLPLGWKYNAGAVTYVEPS